MIEIKSLTKSEGREIVEVSCPLFDNPRKLCLTLLKGREGMELFDTVLRPILLGLSSVADGKGTLSAIAESVLEKLPFETLWDKLGKKLFRLSSIDDSFVINDGDAFENFFGEHRSDFYPLLLAAVMVNFEKDFLPLRKLIGGLSEPKAGAKTPKKSTTV